MPLRTATKLNINDELNLQVMFVLIPVYNVSVMSGLRTFSCLPGLNQCLPENKCFAQEQNTVAPVSLKLSALIIFTKTFNRLKGDILKF